jgi:molybdate transport system substrate-binding protein
MHQMFAASAGSATAPLATAVRLLRGVAVAAALMLGAPSAADALNVYAATSLTNVMPEIERDVSCSFGGSNTLQLQVERGAPADLFLSAEPNEAQALYREGRCQRPVTFATNKLVLIVRQGDPKQIGSIYGLRKGGFKLSVGNPSVPIGDSTRRLLRRLRMSSALTANSVSQQSNVGQVLSQVAFGGADAGFVYVTDARTQPDRIDALYVPQWAQPAVRYQGCVVVRDGADTAGAQALLDDIRSSRGRGLLRRFGFGLPPRA